MGVEDIGGQGATQLKQVQIRIVIGETLGPTKVTGLAI
jgi:hypothetical protein